MTTATMIVDILCTDEAIRVPTAASTCVGSDANLEVNDPVEFLVKSNHPISCLRIDLNIIALSLKIKACPAFANIQNCKVIKTNGATPTATKPTDHFQATSAISVGISWEKWGKGTFWRFVKDGDHFREHKSHNWLYSSVSGGRDSTEK